MFLEVSPKTHSESAEDVVHLYFGEIEHVDPVVPVHLAWPQLCEGCASHAVEDGGVERGNLSTVIHESLAPSSREKTRVLRQINVTWKHLQFLENFGE